MAALSEERFPVTRWSAIRASAEVGAVTRKQGFARLVAAYWRPVYVYLRLRHRCADSDAHDLTQSFFADWWEQNTMASFDPARARFRTFVRLCLDRHVIDHKRSEQAKKRGGEWEHVEVDIAQLERDAALSIPRFTRTRSGCSKRSGCGACCSRHCKSCVPPTHRNRRSSISRSSMSTTSRAASGRVTRTLPFVMACP